MRDFSTPRPDPKQLLLGSFHAAVGAADPLKILPQHLPKAPAGRTLVVGAGKAAASMALAVEQNWVRSAALDGLVLTRYGHSLPTRRIKVVEAGHPVPDAAGEAAARNVMDMVEGLAPDDLCLVLISGGGSSLLAMPAPGVAAGALRQITKDLLRSGAPIQDMNTVRKHLSAIHGGRLASACRAPVLALIISDVTGDDPTHIASGPCAPDPTTYREALEILARYGVRSPASVKEHLERGALGEIPETPKPGDRIFARVENRVIATARQSLQAASAFFEQQGFPAVIIGESVTGEAREVGKAQGALTRQISQFGHPAKPPIALISGGECTVTVRGAGRGGRCTEFLLALGIELAGLPNVQAIACDTDGIDGSEDNAGAVLLPDSLDRAAKMGLNASELLAGNDSYGFFSRIGDIVVTGPTRTNVNDYRAILLT